MTFTGVVSGLQILGCLAAQEFDSPSWAPFFINYSAQEFSYFLGLINGILCHRQGLIGNFVLIEHSRILCSYRGRLALFLLYPSGKFIIIGCIFQEFIKLWCCSTWETFWIDPRKLQLRLDHCRGAILECYSLIAHGDGVLLILFLFDLAEILLVARLAWIEFGYLIIIISCPWRTIWHFWSVD